MVGSCSRSSLAGLGGRRAVCAGGAWPSCSSIYKATRVVNIAIGEMLMVGAYLFFSFSVGLQLADLAGDPGGGAGLGPCSARWSSA
jgi:branched-chain amino acid transport system permease protein